MDYSVSFQTGKVQNITKDILVSSSELFGKICNSLSEIFSTTSLQMYLFPLFSYKCLVKFAQVFKDLANSRPVFFSITSKINKKIQNLWKNWHLFIFCGNFSDYHLDRIGHDYHTHELSPKNSYYVQVRRGEIMFIDNSLFFYAMKRLQIHFNIYCPWHVIGSCDIKWTELKIMYNVRYGDNCDQLNFFFF